MRVVCKTVQ